MTSTARKFLSVIALGALTAASGSARAQVGTGGSSGTGAGTLTDADLYLNVQRTAGTNLTDRDRAYFLNRANCACGTKAYVKAVVQPSAGVKALAVSPSASVSMWVGSPCDPSSTASCCHRLAGVPFSQFRETGIVAETTVDMLVRPWGANTPNCGERFTTVLVSPGTGGAAGTGGASGTGGVSGSGGAGGDSGTGGAGTGGTTNTSTSKAACDGGPFSQVISLFIGTTGEGTRDVAFKSLSFSVDPDPPPPPAGLTVSPVNEALQVSWTGLTTAQAADLLGYQAVCTRGEFTQVFKSGTFTPGFDSCGAENGGQWPGGGTLPITAFVCSDLLPPSANSARLKTLENDVTYYVGLAAIDKQKNPSVVMPLQRKPVLTKDFYYEYRHGDPQGNATGGFCAVAASGSNEATSVGGLALVGLLALAAGRRRRSARRP